MDVIITVRDSTRSAKSHRLAYLGLAHYGLGTHFVKYLKLS